MIYFIIFFAIAIFCILITLIIPIKIKVSFLTKGLGSLNSDEPIKKLKKVHLEIYILGFLKIFKKEIDSAITPKNLNENDAIKSNHLLNLINSLSIETLGMTKLGKALLSKKELKKILKNIKFEEFYLGILFNSENHILNSYINATANTFLCMYINSNIDKFNIKKLRYYVHIGKNVYEIKFNSIIKFRVINNIYELIKIGFRYIKLRKNKREEKDKDGRTSNRKSNDDNYDVS